MSKNKKSDRKNNYQHFKATIGAISEEVDYFGNHKEVLSLNKVHLNTKKNHPVADYAVINKNKATETLFELAHKGFNKSDSLILRQNNGLQASPIVRRIKVFTK